MTSYPVKIPHVVLLPSCPLILFSVQQNSCSLSSHGLFSAINLFFSLFFPGKMTQIILAFHRVQCCNAVQMLQMRGRGQIWLARVFHSFKTIEL